MAEEFEQLPKSLQNFSSTIVHNRNCRNLLICGIIVLMSLSISLSLFACGDYWKHEQTETTTTVISTPATSARDQEPKPSYLKSNRPIYISNINIYENGLHNFDTENSKKINPEPSKEDSMFLKNRQEIIFNLILTATIHHNITLNGIQMQDIFDKSCVLDCDEQRIKEIIKKYIDKIKLINLNNTENDFDDKIYLNDDVNCLNTTDCSNKSLYRIKRSLSDSVELSREKSSETMQDECLHPEYVVFMWVLCLIALATALKLYYLIKTFLAVAMGIFYVTLILATTNVFETENNAE